MECDLTTFTDVLDNKKSMESPPISLDDEIYERRTPIACPEMENMDARNQYRSVNEIATKYRNVFSHPCFNIVQTKIIDDALYSDKSLVVCAPTGSGKTVIFEMAIVQLLMELDEKHFQGDFKIVYIAPVKALCTEKLTEWYPKFTPLGLHCREVTGDTDIEFSQLKPYKIILTTPEKWNMLTRRWTGHKDLVQAIRLFMLDEVHILNDESRGHVLEAIVSRMKTIQLSMKSEYRMSKLQSKDNLDIIEPQIRFIAVSATISNPEDVSAWLSSNTNQAVYYNIGEECRPVKIRKIVEGYPCAEGTSIFKFDMKLNYKLWGVIEKYSNGKPTLIFCSTRKSVLLTAQTLVSQITFQFTEEQRNKLSQLAHNIKDKKLQNLLLHGIGCHHAGYLHNERNIIEHAFKNRVLPILVTTTTLAMGVNLPAHLVIIKSTQQYVNGMYQEYSMSTILQMIGRAGRPQFDTEATAVIMTRLQDKHRYCQLVLGCGPLESSMHRRLAEHLNSEVALGTVTEMAEAVQWARSTFLYIRAAKEPAKYLSLPYGKCTREQIEKKIEDLCVTAMNGLVHTGMINMDQATGVTSTPAGILMASYCLDFHTMKLIMKIQGTETLPDLLNLVCECHELSDMHLRGEEKSCLNKLNRNRDGNSIRYPVKGKVNSRQIKVSCLIQATLGCLTIPDPSLGQDCMKIMRTAERIAKCMVSYLTRPEWVATKPLFYSATVASIVLLKCLIAKLWENTKYVCRQMKGIGPVLGSMLVSAGKITFEAIAESNPRDLERIMNKSAPTGNVLLKQVTLLPKYGIEIFQLEDGTLLVEICLKNFNLLLDNMNDLTAGENHKFYVLVGDSSNTLLFVDFYRDKDILMSEDNIISVTFKPQEMMNQTIFVHCISASIVGIDEEASITLGEACNKYAKTSNQFERVVRKQTNETNKKKQMKITDTFRERKKCSPETPKHICSTIQSAKKLIESHKTKNIREKNYKIPKIGKMFEKKFTPQETITSPITTGYNLSTCNETKESILSNPTDNCESVFEASVNVKKSALDKLNDNNIETFEDILLQVEKEMDIDSHLPKTNTKLHANVPATRKVETKTSAYVSEIATADEKNKAEITNMKTKSHADISDLTAECTQFNPNVSEINTTNKYYNTHVDKISKRDVKSNNNASEMTMVETVSNKERQDKNYKNRFSIPWKRNTNTIIDPYLRFKDDIDSKIISQTLSNDTSLRADAQLSIDCYLNQIVTKKFTTDHIVNKLLQNSSQKTVNFQNDDDNVNVINSSEIHQQNEAVYDSETKRKQYFDDRNLHKNQISKEILTEPNCDKIPIDVFNVDSENEEDIYVNKTISVEEFLENQYFSKTANCKSLVCDKISEIDNCEKDSSIFNLESDNSTEFIIDSDSRTDNERKIETIDSKFPEIHQQNDAVYDGETKRKQYFDDRNLHKNQISNEILTEPNCDKIPIDVFNVDSENKENIYHNKTISVEEFLDNQYFSETANCKSLVCDEMSEIDNCENDSSNLNLESDNSTKYIIDRESRTDNKRKKETIDSKIPVFIKPKDQGSLQIKMFSDTVTNQSDKVPIEVTQTKIVQLNELIPVTASRNNSQEFKLKPLESIKPIQDSDDLPRLMVGQMYNPLSFDQKSSLTKQIVLKPQENAGCSKVLNINIPECNNAENTIKYYFSPRQNSNRNQAKIITKKKIRIEIELETVTEEDIRDMVLCNIEKTFDIGNRSKEKFNDDPITTSFSSTSPKPDENVGNVKNDTLTMENCDIYSQNKINTEASKPIEIGNFNCFSETINEFGYNVQGERKNVDNSNSSEISFPSKNIPTNDNHSSNTEVAASTQNHPTNEAFSNFDKFAHMEKRRYNQAEREKDGFTHPDNKGVWNILNKFKPKLRQQTTPKHLPLNNTENNKGWKSKSQNQTFTEDSKNKRNLLDYVIGGSGKNVAYDIYEKKSCSANAGFKERALEEPTLGALCPEIILEEIPILENPIRQKSNESTIENIDSSILNPLNFLAKLHNTNTGRIDDSYKNKATIEYEGFPDNTNSHKMFNCGHNEEDLQLSYDKTINNKAIFENLENKNYNQCEHASQLSHTSNINKNIFEDEEMFQNTNFDDIFEYGQNKIDASQLSQAEHNFDDRSMSKTPEICYLSNSSYSEPAYSNVYTRKRPHNTPSRRPSKLEQFKFKKGKLKTNKLPFNPFPLYIPK